VESPAVVKIKLPTSQSSADYEPACRIVHRLREAGHTAHFVGGGVRDLILGLTPKDFDIVTSARPPEIEQLFRRTVSVGAKFGVITVLDGDTSHEVATYRAEGGYTDKRRPGWIEYTHLEADLQRRDFTINGLILEPDTGEVTDHVGGLDDLRAGIIRAIGEPVERFSEDALRTLRAVRFASRFGFRIERRTRAALAECASGIASVSGERIHTELEGMFSRQGRVAALVMLRDTGLLTWVMPEVARLGSDTSDTPDETVDESDVAEHPVNVGDASCWARTLRRVAALRVDAPMVVVWSALLADVVAPEEPNADCWDDDGPLDVSAGTAASKIISRQKASRSTALSVRAILERRWVWRYADSLSIGNIGRMIRRDVDGYLREFWHADAQCVGRSRAMVGIDHVWARLTLYGRIYDGLERAPITGTDLDRSGLTPSARYAELLGEAERQWLGERLQTTSAVERWLAHIRME
jgi:tRNA nucleotidyltransferase/poly(A) polymerase